MFFRMKKMPLCVSHGQTHIPTVVGYVLFNPTLYPHRIFGFMALYFWLTRETHQTLGGGVAIDQWLYIHFYYVFKIIVKLK